MQLFNKTFYKFTLGFVLIVAASFLLATIVSHLDDDTTLSVAATEQGE